MRLNLFAMVLVLGAPGVLYSQSYDPQENYLADVNRARGTNWGLNWEFAPRGFAFPPPTFEPIRWRKYSAPPAIRNMRLVDAETGIRSIRVNFIGHRQPALERHMRDQLVSSLRLRPGRTTANFTLAEAPAQLAAELQPKPYYIQLSLDVSWQNPEHTADPAFVATFIREDHHVLGKVVLKPHDPVEAFHQLQTEAGSHAAMAEVMDLLEPYLYTGLNETASVE